MLKKEFAYTDPETEEVKTETYFFHLYDADLVKLKISIDGGMEGMLEQLIHLEDKSGIIAIFDDFIQRSVGYRNERGKFVRTKQFAEEFMSSEQYSDLFLELLGTTEKALAFIKGILPAKLGQELGEQLELQLPGPDEEPKDTLAEGGKKLEEYTRDELLTMSQKRFDELVGTDLQKMSRDHLVIMTQRKLATQAVDKAAAK